MIEWITSKCAKCGLELKLDKSLYEGSPELQEALRRCPQCDGERVERIPKPEAPSLPAMKPRPRPPSIRDEIEAKAAEPLVRKVMLCGHEEDVRESFDPMSRKCVRCQLPPSPYSEKEK